MTRSLLALALAGAGAVLIGAPHPSSAQTAIMPAADMACPASSVDIGALPRSMEAIAKSGELTVVAFGSSSTQGAMSSDAGHTYPAVMQAALEQALPSAHVAVLNRGIGGQDAAEELLRIDTDVAALRPNLIIWQVGANGALRRTDPELFRKLVAGGLERLRRTHADIVVMDNQRSPLIMAAPDQGRINGVLADLAKTAHVAIFSRSALMDEWKSQGEPYEQFIASDGLHHNDRGYRCLGLAFAQAIVKGLKTTQPPVMVSTALPPTPPRTLAAP